MRRLIILIALLLFLQPVFAQTFTVESQERVEVPQLTTRQIEVKVSSSISDTFFIRAVEIKPWMTLGASSIEIEAGSTGSVILHVSPTKETTFGLYKVTVEIESINTGLVVQQPVFIKVIQGELVEIEKILVKGDLYPTGTVDVEIYIKNFKKTSVQNVGLMGSVVSTFPIMEFSEVINRIDPEESVVIKRQLKLEKFAPPGMYTVQATISDPERGSESLNQIFTVTQRAIIEEISGQQSLGVGNSFLINVVNNGNAIKDEYVVERTLSDFESTFYFGDQPSSINENIYRWVFYNIKPGDERTVSYSINYLPLLLLIALIIIAVWYMAFRLLTLRIKKYIMQKKIISQGSEFTVGINIKNSSGRRIKEIVVSDFVPSVFSVKDTPGVNPKKKKTGTGIELTWKINELANGEERIFSYKIIPMFGVTNAIMLPQANVKFKKGKKHKINKSWPTKIGMLEKPKE
jgi:hypothetical protein